MPTLKYWDGNAWQTLMSGLADSLEWIDLGLATNYSLPWSATVMPFTVVKGGSGMTVDANGKMVVQKAGVYHVTCNLTITQTSNYTILNIRQWRAGAVIQQRETVAYNTAGTWDIGTITGTFDAQAGDIFELLVTPGGTGTIVEQARAGFTAFRLSGPGTVQALNAATVSWYGNGGWPTAAPPNNTSGQAITTPAGVLRMTCNVTGYSQTATTPGLVTVYFDGVNVGQMVMDTTLPAQPARFAYGTLVFSRTVTAGTHYVYFQQVSGASDTRDVGSFFGIVTSAVGSISADPATVLNARLTADQALTANSWNRVQGWTLLHSYPVWPAENAGQFMVPADGYYRVDFHGQATTGGNLRASAVFINGAQAQQYNTYYWGTGGAPGFSCWWEGNLRAGDLVDIRLYPDAAVTLSQSYPGNVWLTKLVIRKIYSGGIPGGSGSPDIPWTAPALINGWINYAGAFAATAYRRIGGVVYIKGLVKSGTANTVIFNLPAGCRPTEQLIFTGYSGVGAARIDVAPNGQVNQATGSQDYLSLNGITFPADA